MFLFLFLVLSFNQGPTGTKTCGAELDNPTKDKVMLTGLFSFILFLFFCLCFNFCLLFLLFVDRRAVSFNVFLCILNFSRKDNTVSKGLLLFLLFVFGLLLFTFVFVFAFAHV